MIRPSYVVQPFRLVTFDLVVERKYLRHPGAYVLVQGLAFAAAVIVDTVETIVEGCADIGPFLLADYVCLPGVHYVWHAQDSVQQ